MKTVRTEWFVFFGLSWSFSNMSRTYEERTRNSVGLGLVVAALHHPWALVPIQTLLLLLLLLLQLHRGLGLFALGAVRGSLRTSSQIGAEARRPILSRHITHFVGAQAREASVLRHMVTLGRASRSIAFSDTRVVLRRRQRSSDEPFWMWIALRPACSVSFSAMLLWNFIPSTMCLFLVSVRVGGLLIACDLFDRTSFVTRGTCCS